MRTLQKPAAEGGKGNAVVALLLRARAGGVGLGFVSDGAAGMTLDGFRSSC